MFTSRLLQPNQPRSLSEEIRYQTQLRHEAILKEAGKPQLGMFWVLGENMIMAMVSITDSDQWGDYKTCPKTHEEMWPQYQLSGMAPKGVVWDVYPRGRVLYEVKTRVYHLLADACILKDAEMMNKIKRELNLPPAPHTVSGPDSHYLCSKCLGE